MAARPPSAHPSLSRQLDKEEEAHAPLVLVVEDAEDAWEAVADVLAEAGLRVVGAQNGIDAVDSAVKLLPDLILMDLSLPLMGGCEAARLLKIDSRTRDIPIIALTGHRNFLALAQKAGCDAFLTKPCPADRLLAEIRKQLPQTAAAGAPIVRPTDN